MRDRFLKIFWVALLVVASFTLGYTLRPKTGGRAMPPFMTTGRGMGGGMVVPPLRRAAPPSRFLRR